MNFQSPKVIWDDSSNQVIPFNYPLDMVESRLDRKECYRIIPRAFLKDIISTKELFFSDPLLLSPFYFHVLSMCISCPPLTLYLFDHLLCVLCCCGGTEDTKTVSELTFKERTGVIHARDGAANGKYVESIYRDKRKMVTRT